MRGRRRRGDRADVSPSLGVKITLDDGTPPSFCDRAGRLASDFANRRSGKTGGLARRHHSLSAKSRHFRFVEPMPKSAHRATGFLRTGHAQGDKRVAQANGEFGGESRASGRGRSSGRGEIALHRRQRSTTEENALGRSFVFTAAKERFRQPPGICPDSESKRPKSGHSISG